VKECVSFEENEEASVGCRKMVLIRTEIESSGAGDDGPAKGGVLTVAGSFADVNPAVPEGLNVRAM